MKQVLPIFFLVALMGCQTQPKLSELINDMVVITNLDPSASYGQFATYTLPLDTLGLVSNTSGNQYIANDYAKLVTAAVKRNLDKTGHSRVAKNQSPHLGVNVFVVYDLSVYSSTYYPGYYGGGGGYYGYYGYYGYSPAYTSYQSQESAILVIELIDLKNGTPGSTNNKVIWTANIGDLIQSYDQSRKVEEAIDQAFKQSDYLQR